MKKFKRSFISAMTLGLAFAFLTVACGGDDDDTGGDGDGDGDPVGDGDGDGTGGMNGDGDGDGDTPAECDLSGEGLDREAIPAEPGTITLTSDKVWVLDELVLVGEGDVLTIEPCTRIEGDGVNGVLVIGRGGKIMAEGTAEAPILFTSWAESEGEEPAPGDWGGVILLGKARNNQGDAVAIEGLPEDADYQHGGDDDSDSSGVMSYVRIEYPGVEIAPGNEINGLTLGSVGSRTALDHIMVSNTLDDCFEWFGGAVDGSYLVANACGDDMFDMDQGFTGTLTTLFGRQGSPDSSDPNGFEADSNEGPTPDTNIDADMVTLCGLGEDDAPSETTYGAVLREGLVGSLSNVVIIGFHQGFSLRDEFWDEDPEIVTIADSIVFGNFIENIGVNHESEGGPTNDVDPQDWFEGGDNNSEEDPGFSVADCQAANGPNASVTGSGMGAFAEEDDWMEGAWVRF